MAIKENKEDMNSYQRNVINNILQIKKEFNILMREENKIKEFYNKLLNLFIEIDDYAKDVNVPNEEIYKCLKPLSIYPYVFSHVKLACFHLVDSVLSNIQSEMFIAKAKNSMDINLYDELEFEFNGREMCGDLQRLIELKNQKEAEICFIKTDKKFLEEIKEREMNLNKEKNEQKGKRSNEGEVNAKSLEGKGDREKIEKAIREIIGNENIKVRKEENEINIEVNKGVFNIGEKKEEKNKKKRLIRLKDANQRDLLTEDEEEDESEKVEENEYEFIPKMLMKKRTKGDNEIESKRTIKITKKPKDNKSRFRNKLLLRKEKQLLKEAELYQEAGKQKHKKDKPHLYKEKPFSDDTLKPNPIKEKLRTYNKMIKTKKEIEIEKDQLIQEQKERKIKLQLELKEIQSRKREERSKRRLSKNLNDSSLNYPKNIKSRYNTILNSEIENDSPSLNKRRNNKKENKNQNEDIEYKSQQEEEIDKELSNLLLDKIKEIKAAKGEEENFNESSIFSEKNTIDQFNEEQMEIENRKKREMGIDEGGEPEISYKEDISDVKESEEYDNENLFEIYCDNDTNNDYAHYLNKRRERKLSLKSKESLRSSNMIENNIQHVTMENISFLNSRNNQNKNESEDCVNEVKSIQPKKKNKLIRASEKNDKKRRVIISEEEWEEEEEESSSEITIEGKYKNRQKEIKSIEDSINWIRNEKKSRLNKNSKSVKSLNSKKKSIKLIPINKQRNFPEYYINNLSNENDESKKSSSETLRDEI